MILYRRAQHLIFISSVFRVPFFCVRFFCITKNIFNHLMNPCSSKAKYCENQCFIISNKFVSSRFLYSTKVQKTFDVQFGAELHLFCFMKSLQFLSLGILRNIIYGTVLVLFYDNNQNTSVCRGRTLVHYNLYVIMHTATSLACT